MRGEGWHRAKGGRGGGGVQFETKSRAEEVKETMWRVRLIPTRSTHIAEVFIHISVEGREACYNGRCTDERQRVLNAA